MIPAITSNLTAQEQFYQQRSWKLIAQADQEDPKDDEDITPGKGRDDR
ncbi:hypothetical protein ACP6PK_19815 [Dapis sp. BLCC M172]